MKAHLKGGAQGKPLNFSSVAEMRYVAGVEVVIDKGDISTPHLTGQKADSEIVGYTYISDPPNKTQTVVVRPTIVVDPEQRPVDTFLYEESWRISIPGSTSFVGDVSFQIVFPDPLKVVGETLLAFAQSTTTYRAFRYLAVVAMNGLKQRKVVSPVLDFRCIETDKDAWFDRTCTLTFYTGIPQEIGRSEEEFELV